ncbi:hypothetical protein OROGR_022527 [Orobanche gracilis]
MSMSIFTPFDALCAESFFGNKVYFSSTSLSCTNTDKRDPDLEIDDLKKGKEVKLLPSLSNKKPEARRNSRTPRFAPELDGVHCFENILPY